MGTDKTSFSKVQHWIEELRKIVGKDIILVIAANKMDLESKRQVEVDRVNSYAQSVGAIVIGTSAKTGKGVHELFLELTKLLLKQQASIPDMRNRQKSRGPKTKITIVDDEEPKNKSGGCCNVLKFLISRKQKKMYQNVL